jgi:CDP-diacylglycerol--glycerol-3-phosphate 3-phosphatidyltransferase
MYWNITPNFILPIDVIAHLSIWFMVAVSVLSAVDYFAAFWSRIDRRAVQRRRRAFVLSRRRKNDVAAT